MKLGVLALLAAGSLSAARATDAHVQRVEALVAAQRASVNRLAAAAAASGKALFSGGSFYLCCGEGAWTDEGNSRAGGPMALGVAQSVSQVKARDVVWVSYTASTYEAVAAAAAQAPQGTVVVGFGPKPPSGRAAFPFWIDSLTEPGEDDGLTLMGNVLSLWSMVGEVAAETARGGKTMVFWESVWVPGAGARNPHYANAMFHHGPPKMERIQAGVLSAAYLDYVGGMVKAIAEQEMPKILEVAKTVNERAAAGTPATLVAMSHLIPAVAKAGNAKLKLAGDANGVNSNGYLVYLGYYGVDLEMWRTVRLAGTNAAWIVSPIARQTDFSSYGDIVVDQHWDFGDGAVAAPGYDVPILPPSGVAQLFIYELLKRAI